MSGSTGNAGAARRGRVRQHVCARASISLPICSSSNGAAAGVSVGIAVGIAKDYAGIDGLDNSVMMRILG